MAISPQQLTIYLYSAHRAVIFAIAQLSCLSGRKQRVVVEEASSEELDATSGVPHGSVLGPCLFLYYINDIAQGLTSTVRLFCGRHNDLYGNQE